MLMRCVNATGTYAVSDADRSTGMEQLRHGTQASRDTATSWRSRLRFVFGLGTIGESLSETRRFRTPTAAFRALGLNLQEMARHGNVSVSRHRGHAAEVSERRDSPPSWIARWDQQNPGASIPDERCFNSEYMLYFENVASAAAAWTGNRGLAQKNHAETSYRIVIPDERAYFSDLVAERDALKVIRTGEYEGNLFCAGTLRMPDGSASQIAEEVSNGEARIRLSRTPESIDLHLFAVGGHEFDWFHSASFNARLGESLLDPMTGFVSANEYDLESARQQ